jgi:predicted nucleotidyltransferase component of viral defense system
MKEAGVNYNKGQLGQMAKQYGFVRDTFEKVLRLKEILTYLNVDEYLHEHLALKGGTAINMTIFNLPRLSVDLDLDFTPNLPLEDMEKARRKITEMLERYMTEEGYFLSESSRYSHSLDSMLFQYHNAGGNRDNIKLELNYSLRSHIFTPVERRIVMDIFEEDVIVRTLEPMEIFAAKANALMSRAAARDLYDFNNMIYFDLFDESEYELFRKCTIFYASISADKINKTFETSAIDGLEFSKIRRDLFPVLRRKDNFNLDKRKEEAKKFIEELMVLTPEEVEYLELFEKGEYRPEFLFGDDEIIWNIKEHPMAVWKMKNEQGMKMMF